MSSVCRLRDPRFKNRQTCKRRHWSPVPWSQFCQKQMPDESEPDSMGTLYFLPQVKRWPQIWVFRSDSGIYDPHRCSLNTAWWLMTGIMKRKCALMEINHRKVFFFVFCFFLWKKEALLFQVRALKSSVSPNLQMGLPRSGSHPREHPCFRSQ